MRSSRSSKVSRASCTSPSSPSSTSRTRARSSSRDEVKVKILEIDSERRRLSLSIKRVEGQVLPRRTEGLTGDAGDLEDMPELGLSEDVFAEGPAVVEDDTPESEAAEAAVEDAPVFESADPDFQGEPTSITVEDTPVEASEVPAAVEEALEAEAAPETETAEDEAPATEQE